MLLLCCAAIASVPQRAAAQPCHLLPASGPVPADNASLTTQPAILDWDDSNLPSSVYYVEFNGAFLPGPLTDSQTSVPAGLQGGTYQWRVTTQAPCGVTTGPLWTYTVPCPTLSVPANPTPADNASMPLQPSILDWDDSNDPQAVYHVELNGSFLPGPHTTSQVSLPPNLPDGVYQWRVVSQNNCEYTTGPLWTYTVSGCSPPSAASNPTPANNDVLTAEPPILDWDDSASLTTPVYHVELNGIILPGPQTSSQITPPPGLPDGVYHWRVITEDSCGYTTGPLWTYFQHAPQTCHLNTPSGPIPADGAVLTVRPSILDWDDSNLPGSVYYVELNGTYLPGPQTSSQITLPPDLPDGVYQWRVVTEASCGFSVGPLWTYTLNCTPASVPANPTPANNSILTAEPPVLDWDDDANTSDPLYYVELNGVFLPGPQTTSQITPPPGLPDGVYHWRVTTQNSCGYTTGPVWTYFQHVPQTCHLLPAANPTPADHAFLTTQPLILDWDNSNLPGSLYYVEFNGTYLPGPQTASQVSVPPGLPDGVYQWRVVTQASCGFVIGPLWTYTVGCASPSVPSNPVPADNAVLNSQPAILDWDDAFSTSPVYYVELNGSFLPGPQTTSEVTLPPGLPNGVYKWRVTTQDGCGITTGPLWTYTVTGCIPPSVPANPSPPNNSFFNSQPALLDWDDSSEAGVTYDVEFNGSYLPGPQTVSQVAVPSGLPDGVYKWKVVTHGSCADTTGPLWTYVVGCAFIPPPSNPYPQDGETTYTNLTTLSWDPVPGATLYTVTLDSTTFPPQPGNSFTFPLPPPVPEATYTWHVDADVPGCGLIPGPTWTFKVCDQASTPVRISPADGTTTSTLPVFFDWTDTANTLQYRVVIDTPGFTGVFGPTTNSYFTPPFGFAPGQISWYVIADSDCDHAVSTSGTFCVMDPPSGYTITPAENSVLTTSPAKLDWQNVDNALSYDLEIDGSLVATGLSVSEYFLPAPLAPGPHTWQIFAMSPCGDTMPGPVYHFCIGDVAGLPDPLSGSTTCSGPPQLSWSAALGAVGYDLYIDGVQVLAGSPTTQYLLGTQSVGTHTWRVDTHGTCGTTTGTVWTFNVGGTADVNVGAWSTDGPVYAVVQHRGKAYIGGNFTRLYDPFMTTHSVVRNNFAVLRLPDGTPDTWAPPFNGTIRALVADDSGLYAAGEFTSASGQIRNHAAHLLYDAAAPDIWNPNVNGRVDALAVSGGAAYLGGQFLSVGGQSRKYAAAVDAAGGSVLSWNPSPNSFVRALAVTSNTVFIGGSFSKIGSTNAQALAAVDTGGNLLSWNAGINRYVYALSVNETSKTLWVGGSFDNAGGALRANLAALDLNTGIARPWNPSPNGAINCIWHHGTAVYVGGLFSSIAGANSPYMVALDELTGLPIGCAPPAPDYPINSVGSSGTAGDAVVIGGDFTYMGPLQKRGYAVLGATQSQNPIPAAAQGHWEQYE